VSVVLGIDAAWTAGQPSGVALVRSRGRRWECVALAPSYASFLALADDHVGDARVRRRSVHVHSTRPVVDWAARPGGDRPDPAALHAAASRLAGAAPDVIAIDMPLAATPIVARRTADNAIASAYATRGLGAHSPSPERPGPIAHAMCGGFAALGYAIATTSTAPRARRVLIEAFPHASAIFLSGSDYRVPYKLGRMSQYWPERTPAARRRALLGRWSVLRRALAQRIDGIDLRVPSGASASALKRYEDALDALICAWTGIAYLAGELRAYGDALSAVWAP
jgi:predicted RNase H-like nuclease